MIYIVFTIQYFADLHESLSWDLWIIALLNILTRFSSKLKLSTGLRVYNIDYYISYVSIYMQMKTKFIIVLNQKIQFLMIILIFLLNFENFKMKSYAVNVNLKINV